MIGLLGAKESCLIFNVFSIQIWTSGLLGKIEVFEFQTSGNPSFQSQGTDENAETYAGQELFNLEAKI